MTRSSGQSTTVYSRRLAVAVRRDPTIAPSDSGFVDLPIDMLEALQQRAAALERDDWRIALAVAGLHSGATRPAR